MFPVEAWTRIFEYLDDQSLRTVADTAYVLRWVVDQMRGPTDPERYKWLAAKGLLRKRHFAGEPKMLRLARMSPILRNMAVLGGHPETILILTAGSRISWARHGNACESARPGSARSGRVSKSEDLWIRTVFCMAPRSTTFH